MNDQVKPAMEPKMPANASEIKHTALHTAGSLLTPEQAVQPGEKTVLMMFPRPVRLQIENGVHIQFKTGPNDVPERFRNHRYLKSNGVVPHKSARVAVSAAE